VNVRFLSVAELDAAAAALWYDDQQPALGDRFFAELEHAIDRIRQNPQFLPRSECYNGDFDVRQCRLHRFPYVVVFRCTVEEVVVLAVSDARRDPSHWLERLK
jgi:plasmid stabilization system protein ParE